MHLTALNVKSEPESELVAEFDRRFSKEPAVALAWAFEAWRDESRFFPAVADIRKLLRDWHRGQRERKELEEKLDQQFRLDQARQRGEILSYPELLKLLREDATKMAEPEHVTRMKKFRTRMSGITQIIPSLHLSEEQIKARREKDRAECERYREHSDNEFCE